MKKNLFENAELELILFGSDVLTTSNGTISDPDDEFNEEITGKTYSVDF